MNRAVVTIAVWQTLLDESPGFGDQVRGARIACVIEAVGRATGDPVDADSAGTALDFAADKFETAYLSGAPIDNIKRVQLIGAALDVHFSADETRHLADALGKTHVPTNLRTRPGLRQMLQELSRERTVVALSDTWMSPGAALRASLAHHGLSMYLADELYSDETGSFKVTGEAWRLAANRLGTSVDRIIHIGDLPDIDGAGAAAAGCAAAIVIQHPNHPVPSRRSGSADVRVVTDPRVIPAVVAELDPPSRTRSI